MQPDLKYTEKQLNNMASPVSQSEEEKCKNAIKMIRDAMKELNYTKRWGIYNCEVYKNL